MFRPTMAAMKRTGGSLSDELFPRLPAPAQLEVDVLFEVIDERERAHSIHSRAEGRDGKVDPFAAIVAALMEGR